MTSKYAPLVSVVTPVYNGEPYLRECIESIMGQTYTNWDYTIINNCSTDRSLDIAKEYAAKDPRIRIHSNDTFVRVVRNFNIAFRQISSASKYCKVVAADDWLFPECVEKMVRLAEEHPSVAIVGAYGLYSRPEMGIAWQGVPYSSTVVPGREACRSLLLGGPYVFGTATSVLYRSDILRSRHAFYNESNFHADMEACLEFLENYDFGFLHQILTFRRVQEDSLTAYSKGVNTYLAGNLHGLLTYGQKYLTENELKRRIRNGLQDYYCYLGQQVYRGRDREFWRFHKRKLETLGYPLSTVKIISAAIAHGLDIVLNPKRTAEEVLRQLRVIFSESSHRVEVGSRL